MAIESKWFTITKIDNYTFALRELHHDEETNSFLLIGNDEALLIDTGMGVKNIFDVVKTLTDKPLKVVITHAHRDHIGNIDLIDKVYIHKAEASWLKHFPISNKQVKEELNKTSFSFPKNFNLNEYKVPTHSNIVYLEDNEIIDIGGRKIKCIHTPGHSPGHMCFYDL